MKFLAIPLLWIVAVAGAPLLAAADSAAKNSPYLEPIKPASWWYADETVRYRPAGGRLPDGLTELEVIITNVAGDQVAQASVKRETLLASGWEWKPSSPGYYEVEFSSVAADGNKTALGRSFPVKTDNGNSRVFTRTRQGFAVLPKPSGALKPVGQFGFDSNGSPMDLMLGKLMGYDLVRLLVNWGADFIDTKAGIESVQGEQHWTKCDQQVDLFARAGFVINAQINYTPLWASPHPDQTKINICVVEGTTYAPTNLSEFSRFVETTVLRYKDRIRLWEIWNEPSIPGGSIYWSDTPENFVKLLQAGYTSVKKVQPGAEVWIGGLGPRSPYHAFYDKILKLGAAKFFDVLSLHGAWNTPAENFRDIDKANAVASKPAVSGEWHAVLQGNMQSEPILSETALSYKMMQDLFYQLKQGITRVMLFEMVNLSEKETLPFNIENKTFTHASGLFRRLPQVEPRQPAVVMANFLDVTARQVTQVREFELTDKAVALQMTTGAGPLVVFWSETEKLGVAALRPFTTAKSVLRDWEGKAIALDGDEPLNAKQIYYLTSVNANEIAKAQTANKLLSPRLLARASQTAPGGVFYVGKLFDPAARTVAVPESAWIQKDWKQTALNGSATNPKFSAKAAVGAHPEGLDVVVEVVDATHHQKEPQPAWWNGDSLQLAIDCEGTGRAGGFTEIVTALTDKGPAAWKLAAADPHGDIPANWSPANGFVKHASSQIVRENGTTSYRLRLPWSELYPLTYNPAKGLRVALVVNNNDGAGRAAYLEWASGIAREKDSSRYGLLKSSPGK